jgi:multimeric flavodoxin WrbA
MKTLIFNGSPRKNGDTVFLINKLKESLNGEVRVIDAYFTEISPCIDCRYCWKNCGCAIQDEMQEVYSFIKECDNIVIASPVYFSELTGSLLTLASRLQTFYSSKRFLGISQIQKKKKGAVILCGGGDGAPDRAEATAKDLLKMMGAELNTSIRSLNTDNIPSRDDNTAKAQIDELAVSLNNLPK